ncbi:HTH-type transcriptional repressor RghR [Lignipirellula cremea]|uniref:HTH-type transcriptional repressor RghR n=2 Tax=Lignipirellula cremea TaxID=2528010 RepID=A0A518E3B6_9BACT|nr:HTH-type transcriptional repressor RghR [Lignipirellula cremea]
MAKKSAKSDKQPGASSTSDQTLGKYLSSLRGMKKMTLREVEDATDKEVSNAYLSQLENDKIAKPAPSILHALAAVYGQPYEKLMGKAGYLPASSATSALRSGKRHGRAATFANENLTDEEEEKLIEYLSFLRSRRGKGGSS